MPGETVDVLVKDYQEDLTKERITHLDFFEIERGKLLRTHVHLHLEGSPIGVREGGLLETLTHSLEIECLPRNLPERISVDISGLVIGQSVHVRDVTPPEGVTIRTPVDQTVCLVTVHKVVEEKPAVTEEEEAALAAAEAEPQETEEQA
jgi:large subunit ribosomal protein L25